MLRTVRLAKSQGSATMAFKITNGRIHSQDGRFLKTIACEKRAGIQNLSRQASMNYSCGMCEKAVYNTDYLSEVDLLSLLESDPNICLYVNKENPMFEIED